MPIRRAAHFSLCLLVAGLCLAPLANAVANQPSREAAMAESRHARAQVLMTHGINTTPAALRAFLRNGFPSSAAQRGLPRNPEVKSEVVVAAIQEIGIAGYRELAPEIQGFLRNEFPEGANRVIRGDLEGLPLRSMEERDRIYRRHMVFASLVTAGYLGDASLADDVYELTQRESGIGVAREGAISLAMLGDDRALQVLAQALARHNTPEQQADLFAAVFYVTGRNYGVRDVTSIARRREAVQEFRTWQTSQGRIDGGREDIQRRRTNGPNFPDPPVGSLRGALRAVATFGDYERRYAAREHLRRVSPDSASELRAIAEDPLEDLDIRRQAMQWYAAVEPREARRTVRRLRNDENELISRTAEQLLVDIEEAISAQGGGGWGLF